MDDSFQMNDRHALFGFFEVSAMTGENIEKAFKQLAYYLVDRFHSSLVSYFSSPLFTELCSNNDLIGSRQLNGPQVTTTKATGNKPVSTDQTQQSPSSNPFAKQEGTVKLGGPVSQQPQQNQDCKC